MTANANAADGAASPSGITRAMVGTALTAVLAVLFGLSVMVEVSNTPDLSPRADKPRVALQARSEASSPTSGHAGERPVEGRPTAF